MIGNLPVKLLGDLESGRFLSFETVGIHRIQQIYGRTANHFGKYADAATGAKEAMDAALATSDDE